MIRETITEVGMLVLYAVACAPTPARAPVAFPAAVLVVHADTAFLPGERRAISAGAESVEIGTGGRVAVAITYDLDFGYLPSLAVPEGTWRMLRTPASADVIIAADARHHARVLALTLSAARDVLLVHDRIGPLYARWAHVTTHELLHAVGAEHVAGGVLEIATPADGGALALAPSDVDEVCRVLEVP